MGIEKDLDSFKIDKEEWQKTITTNKRKILKVFLAGAGVATGIWWLVFYIYLETGFVGIR